MSSALSVPTRDLVSPSPRPSRLRYILVVLLPLTAVVAAVMWGFSAYSAVNAEADKFVRGDVPGVVTVEGHPGTWKVFAEGDVRVTGVRVTDAAGEIPVRLTKPASAGYDHGGMTPSRVATFTVRPGRIGQWRVEVTGTTGANGGGFAVGEFNINGFMRVNQWGMAGLLVVNVGAAAAIALLPVLRHHHHHRLPSDQAGVPDQTAAP